MGFITGILGKTAFEVVKGLLFQIAWSAILERFLTRLVIWSLEKLKNLSTNDVVEETIEDIIQSLRGKKLKEVPDKQRAKQEIKRET